MLHDFEDCYFFFEEVFREFMFILLDQHAVLDPIIV